MLFRSRKSFPRSGASALQGAGVDAEEVLPSGRNEVLTAGGDQVLASGGNEVLASCRDQVQAADQHHDGDEALPGEGVKKLVMITPGFSSDCVETLEEVAIGLAETFHEHGGEKFSVVPCLNDSPESITLLTTLARECLTGWV